MDCIVVDRLVTLFQLYAGLCIDIKNYYYYFHVCAVIEGK